MILSMILCRSKSVAILSSIRASHITGHYNSSGYIGRYGQFSRHCIMSPHPALGEVIFQSHQTYLFAILSNDFKENYSIKVPVCTENDIFDLLTAKS